MCEKWSSVAESLTIQYWKNYTSHPWKGKKFNSSNLQQLIDRLEEVSHNITVLEIMVGHRTKIDVCLVLIGQNVLAENYFATSKLFILQYLGMSILTGFNFNKSSSMLLS